MVYILAVNAAPKGMNPEIGHEFKRHVDVTAELLLAITLVFPSQCFLFQLLNGLLWLLQEGRDQ